MKKEDIVKNLTKIEELTERTRKVNEEMIDINKQIGSMESSENSSSRKLIHILTMETYKRLNFLVEMYDRMLDEYDSHE